MKAPSLVVQSEPLWFRPFSIAFFSSCHAPPWRPWLCLNLLPTRPGRLLLGPLKPSPLQAEPAEIPQPFLKGQVLQHPTTIVALRWTHAGLSMTFLYWGAKIRHGILGMTQQVLSRGADPSPPVSCWLCPHWYVLGVLCCQGTAGLCPVRCPPSCPLQPLMLLASLDSGWALAFLTPSLCAQAMFLKLFLCNSQNCV